MMQMDSQNTVLDFKLLPCRVGGNGNEVVSQVRYFMFGDAHVFIAWHEKTVHIIETPGLTLGHHSSSYTLHDPVLLDAPAENVVRLGESIRCLDKSGGFYELKLTLQPLPANSMYEEDMFSDGESTLTKQYKFVKNLKLNKVVRLTSLRQGLALIKKQDKDHAYVMNFYTNKLAKKFSVHLPNFTPQEEADCFLMSCASRLEQRLAKLLLGESLSGDTDVLFAGWGGNVYTLAVNFSKTSQPVPRLVYHSDHSVISVLLLEGPTEECCAVAIVLSVGCLVCLVPATQLAGSLGYVTLYLPTSSCRVLCSLCHSILCGDGRHLWLCRVVLQPAVDLNTILLPVKSVVALTIASSLHSAFAITMYGDMYMLDMNYLWKHTEGESNGGILAYSRSADAATNVLQAIHEGTSKVQELSQQIAIEDHLIAGLNIATRINSLQKYFELQVTVDCMDSLLVQPSTVSNLWSANTKGFYQLNVCIRNLTHQQFQSPTWSMVVSTRSGSELCTRVVDLGAGLSEHHPVQLRLPLAVPSPGDAPVRVACHLVSQMLRPGRPWVLIAVGDCLLDVSYFFEVHPDVFPSRLLPRKDGSATLRKELVDMACANNLSLHVELNYLRLLRNEELISVLKFRKQVEPRNLFNVLLAQCRHRLSAEVQAQYIVQGDAEASKAPRSLVIHAGCKKVAVSMDSSCTMVTLSCCDVRLLHAVRTLLTSRLETCKRSGTLPIATELFHKADNVLSALEDMDALYMQNALQDWRRYSSQRLPF